MDRLGRVHRKEEGGRANPDLLSRIEPERAATHHGRRMAREDLI
jgi:hypothetical protein